MPSFADGEYLEEFAPYIEPNCLVAYMPARPGGDILFALGVSDALPVYYPHESELKHGRVCVLAVFGWIAMDVGMLSRVTSSRPSPPSVRTNKWCSWA